MLTGPRTPDCVAPFPPAETCGTTEAPEEAQEAPEETLLSVFGSDPEGFLRNWMQRLAGLRVPAFILFTTFYAFISKIVSGIVVYSLLNLGIPGKGAEPNEVLDVGRMVADDGLVVTLLGVIFFAPVLETLLGQGLPIQLMRRFTRRPGALLWSSTAFFTLMHVYAGWIGVTTGISVGILLAFSYLRWERVSVKRAYWITTAIHGLHNGLALLFALIFKT